MLSHSALCRLAAKKAGNANFPPEVINRILRYGAPVGASFLRYHRLPRCMDVLRNQVRNGHTPPVTGSVVRADILTGSSGRFGRCWHAPIGGLYLALLWADTLLPEFSRQLPFAAGIACCETVQQYIPAARLKWVNDVQARGKKICGILSEMITGPEGEQFHLLGIGLNVNIRHFPEALQPTATALCLETGRSVDLDEVCAQLLAGLQWNFGLLYFAEEQMLQIGQVEEGGGKSLLLERWLQLCDTPGRRVIYGYDVQKKPLYRAMALDVDSAGGLVMELEDGSIITEYSGEILYPVQA